MGAYSDLLILAAYAIAVIVVGGILAHRSQSLSKANSAAAAQGLPAAQERRAEAQPARHDRREAAGHGIAG